MADNLHDRTGAAVTVSIDESRPVSAFIVTVADGSPAGRADFVDSPTVDQERIFFHTEVDREFSGRGLAGILIREALADSIRTGRTVVPVCPLFAGHLDKHGDDFVADGGRFRLPTKADLAVVRRATRAGS
ncbi:MULTISPECIES: GNAT family N-acetyltransferase [Pseudonocardia]|uniref:N-acetyltransferase domain-containing protein n=2 Tax=Pseudonocardia TaxID=1847 RepID=A0A1Y2MZQ8_PSEAH|nr:MULTISPECIES: GNAT family N-acetyltransferase [Pseudonocardia]OSY40704.1 hypothetical protein BG845_02462 [Pseudonocardia autotrophica]TDN71989.1 hypothetical protein C8E95_1025 [Pseudonocardia autotrophica]BBG02676.1 hypothetical protein Pdca_38850 [Pseudonocardia autotrophica]GEC29365.1 hypothetical protein PSA01_63940 [Pseudonocardia saturnea]